MHNGVMKAWLESSHLAGANATYVEDLYELYLSDPDLVSEEWKRVFDGLPAHPTNVVDNRTHASVTTSDDSLKRLSITMSKLVILKSMQNK